MNPKIRIAIVAVALLGVVGLIIALTRGNGSITPAAPTPSSGAGITAAPDAAAQTAPNVPGSTDTASQSPSDAATVDTPARNATAIPGGPTAPSVTVIMTDKEKELMVEAQRDNPQSVTSPDQCDEVLKTEPWCSQIQSVKQITRPEWEQMLPKTQFYLGEYDRYGGPSVQKMHFLIVEQDGQRYAPKNFDLLLTANGIEFTDDNRELIAKALALMTIPDYLGEGVTFTKWETVNYTAQQAGYPYNYNLQAWTKLGGWEVAWWFVFGNTRLEVASGPSVGESGTGDYIEQPVEDPALDSSPTFYSSFQDYVFVGR